MGRKTRGRGERDTVRAATVMNVGIPRLARPLLMVRRVGWSGARDDTRLPVVDGHAVAVRRVRMETLAMVGAVGGGVGAALLMVRLGMSAVIALMPSRRG